MVFPGISGAPLLIKPPSGPRVQEVFNVSTWVGNGSSATINSGISNSIGSLVWIKRSSGASTDHLLFDTERGPGSYWSSNSNNAEISDATTLTSFNATSYEVGSSSLLNAAGTTNVGWQFRRKSNFFDMVSYSGNGVAGRTIAHNLGVKPSLIIVKRINNTGSPVVYSSHIGAANGLTLDSTAASATANYWNSTEPTSSVFSVSSVGTVNNSVGTYVAYLFADDPSPDGMIRCGAYTGDGAPGGLQVSLGWRPQFIMIKATSFPNGWAMLDTARGISSGNDQVLYANTGATNASEDSADLYSGGFIATGVANTSGVSYIYVAIREP